MRTVLGYVGYPVLAFSNSDPPLILKAHKNGDANIWRRGASDADN